jgi:hypothetical protein
LDCVFAVEFFLFSMQRYPTLVTYKELMDVFLDCSCKTRVL